MSIDTSKREKDEVRVVLDTNILISAFLFGGKPREVFSLVLHKQILAVTSYFLLAELSEVLVKKFGYSKKRILQVEKKIEDKFIIVRPRKSIKVLEDEPDNRVLEVAAEGKCKYIITGDKELLNLRRYRTIKILSANQFLLRFNRRN